MKRIISTTLKALLMIGFNCLVFILVCCIFDHMDSLIIGKYSLFDIRDWWYEQTECHMISFLSATAVLSGLMYFVYKIIDGFITNKVFMVIGIIAGALLLNGSNYWYWSYVWRNCFMGEWSLLEEALTTSFVSQQGAILLCGVYVSILLVVGVLSNHAELLMGHSRKRVVCRQVFWNTGLCGGFLYFGIPYMIMGSGIFFVVSFLRITIVPIVLIISSVVVLYILFLQIVRAIRLNNYYQSIENDPEKQKHLVIFQESDYVKCSYIVQLLFGKETRKKLIKNNIWLYPSELELSTKAFIKLDFYDEWMFIRKSAKNDNNIYNMTRKRGTFNLAYNLEQNPSNRKLYDACYGSIDKLTDGFVIFDEYLSFKNEVSKELQTIDLTRLKRATCISEEIEEFKNYLINQTTNQFIMFDLIIKWLEIVNFFFAITSISVSGKKMSEMIENEIDHADFKKWRDVFNNTAVSSEFDKWINEYSIEKDIFDTFNELWEILASRFYSFQGYSLRDLLEACNYLRDYTRGHGVFTFEISQEINLRLLKLLVSLIKSLIEYQQITDMKDNLESLGWVLYSGDVPYFLYSIDKNNEESTYESFRKGNSLSMPIDMHR